MLSFQLNASRVFCRSYENTDSDLKCFMKKASESKILSCRVCLIIEVVLHVMHSLSGLASSYLQLVVLNSHKAQDKLIIN